MQQETMPVLKDLVLIGGGHSHVAVLKRFGMEPIPGVRVTLIARDVHTPYSGMLPGFVAGHYQFDQAHVDLRPLCQFAGARLLHDEAIGIDTANRCVLCRARPPVSYDVLSINIGSRPGVAGVPGAANFTLPVKPINRFVEHWTGLVERVLKQPGPQRIGVVGAGAGGVEMVLAAQYRLRYLFNERGRDSEELEFHLVSRSERILPAFDEGVSARFEKVLEERGIVVHRGSAAAEANLDGLTLVGGLRIELDEMLWVTAASAPGWLADAQLDVDAHGFVTLRETLQSTSHTEVFAAGDIANVIAHPRQKSGVIAVRQGPALSDNLRRALLNQKLKPFRPQTTTLALISTGDKYAIASKGILHAEGHWLWWLKDWIDQRWMRKYSALPDMNDKAKFGVSTRLADRETLQEISAIAMRCGGCGAKVGANVLTRALAELAPAQRDDVLIGLHEPDDAAVVEVPDSKVMVHTVDYFRSFIDDPYLFGQIAANHSLSDAFAMAAEPQTALAIATVPFGLEKQVEDTVKQMMAGALKVLNAADTALVGGHTSEGAELALGFAINALADRERLLRKGGMRPGDRLILTKALGTGTLFAADMQHKAKGRWIEQALTSMIQSNREAADCLYRHGASACTDITGFGLLGHLVEMIKPSGVDVSIDLSALPILDGALNTLALGILSSLQPANVRLRRVVANASEVSSDERYPLLFDPQTSGGLLASVSEEKAVACLTELIALGFEHTTVIGEVKAQGEALEPVTVVT